jgi:hypothetical protein
MEYLARAERVILVDAVSMGARPGTIRVFSGEDVERGLRSCSPVLHTFHLVDVIGIAARLGIRPAITIVGIQPYSTDFGDHLTLSMVAKVPALVETVLRHAEVPVARSVGGRLRFLRKNPLPNSFESARIEGRKTRAKEYASPERICGPRLTEKGEEQ